MRHDYLTARAKLISHVRSLTLTFFDDPIEERFFAVGLGPPDSDIIGHCADPDQDIPVWVGGLI